MNVPVERPKAVSVIGWTVLVLALLRLLENGVFYLLWRFGGLREGFPFQGALDAHSPLHIVDRVLRHLGPILGIQTTVAALLAFVAWNLLQLRPWARKVLEAVCWAGLLLLVAATIFFVVVWNEAVAATSGPEADRLRIWGPIAAAGVALVMGGLLGVVIWNLRRPDVRLAFGRSSA
jgi:hypothetical protein